MSKAAGLAAAFGAITAVCLMALYPTAAVAGDLVEPDACYLISGVEYSNPCFDCTPSPCGPCAPGMPELCNIVKRTFCNVIFSFQRVDPPAGAHLVLVDVPCETYYKCTTPLTCQGHDCVETWEIVSHSVNTFSAYRYGLACAAQPG